MSSTLNNPIDRTRYLIARSDHFRAWCGITTGAEDVKLTAALARVHRVAADLRTATAPFAAVHWGNYHGNRTGMGGGAWMRTSSIITAFFATHSGNDSEAQIITDLLALNDTVRSIIDDMLTLSGAGTHIHFDSFRRENPPRAMPQEANRTYLVVQYEWTGTVWGSQTEA